MYLNRWIPEQSCHFSSKQKKKIFYKEISELVNGVKWVLVLHIESSFHPYRTFVGLLAAVNSHVDEQLVAGIEGLVAPGAV